MSYLTKYGSLWGQIPVTPGRVFWVAPSASYVVSGETFSASDTNDGESPARALLTLGQAVTLATANVGDVIVLLPGAHSWSASVALSKAGLTIMGLPSGKGHPEFQRTSVTISISDQVFNVTAADIEIAYLDIIGITAMAAIDFTAAASRLYIHDCSFDMYTPAVNSATTGVAATAATINCPYLCIENCTFIADGAQGPAIAVGDSTNYKIKNNTFKIYAGVWAAACTGAGSTNQSGVWLDNKWLSVGSSAITTGIDGTGLANTGGVGAIGNFFSFATGTPFDTWGAGTLYIAENYKANTGGGSGGALITAIT